MITDFKKLAMRLDGLEVVDDSDFVKLFMKSMKDFMRTISNPQHLLPDLLQKETIRYGYHLVWTC